MAGLNARRRGPSSRLSRALALTWLCLLAVQSCGDGSGPNVSRFPSAMLVVGGQDQSGVVGEELAEPLRVRAVDANGNPIPQQVVNFRVVQGGGSVFAGAAITNNDGIAQELWTLGTSTADIQRVEVRAVNPTTGEPLVFGVFNATPLADVPTALSKNGGDTQQSVVGTALTDSLAVRATDQYGNPAPGAVVTWTTGSGHGSASPTSSTTGSDGIARTRWTLGPGAGPQTASAAAAGLAGSPIAFTSSGVAGNAAKIGIATAPSDTARNNVAWPRQPVIQLQDEHGNPVSQAGVTVTVALTSGGGRLVGLSSANTASTGSATFSGLSIAGVEGARTLTFSTSAFGMVGTSLHLVGGIPANVHIDAGNNQGAEAGTAVAIAPTVRVVDLFGNNVELASVTFAVGNGGGSITGATQTTDESGRASVGSWTLGTGAGPNTLSASAQGTSGPVSGTIAAQAWLPYKAQSVSAGSNYTCARSESGQVHCWGANTAPGKTTSGQLGINEPSGQWSIPLVVHGGLDFVSVFTGEGHTCALTSAGKAYCWGYNVQGQVGDGSTINRFAPVAVATTETFQTLALGGSHTCGLTTAGHAYCWGFNNVGQLGNLTTAKSSTPVAVAGGRTFVSIVASGSVPGSDQRVSDGHTCALTADGTAFCWGASLAGQIGNDREGVRTSDGFAQIYPDEVNPPGQKFQSIAAGLTHTCGVAIGGAAYCWGSNFRGQLGTGNTTSSRVPVAVTGGISFQSVVAEEEYSCGLATSGSVHCWGRNVGQFGNGQQVLNETSPTPSASGQSFVSLAAGGGHACGIRSDAVLYCWGINSRGGLGDDTMVTRLVPVKVHAPQP